MDSPGENALVLDSYAVLEFLDGSQAGESVGELLRQAASGRMRLLMSAVNLGEVAYSVERRRGLMSTLQVIARLGELPIAVMPADRAQALAAARIKARWPVAYADCFAAALAGQNGAPVVTGDAEFRLLEAAGVVRVMWL